MMHYGFCRKHADQMGEGGCPECAMDHQQNEILALRAKLKEAELVIKEMSGAPFALYHNRLRDGSGKCGEPCGLCRAEAAEAALKSLIDLTKYSGEVKELLSDPLMVAAWTKEGIEGANALRDETLADNQRLQAEVARLTLERDQWKGVFDRSQDDEAALRTRIAELEAEVEAAYMRGCEVSEKSWRRDGAEAALRWAWDWIYETEHGKEVFIQRGLKALLGEGKP